MRLPVSVSDTAVLVASAEVLVGGALQGGWSATRWEYRSSSAPGRSVDVVCQLGGSVALSLSGTLFILASEIPGRGRCARSGTFVELGDVLQLAYPDSGESDTVRFQLAGDTLSLSGSSQCDFEGAGKEEAAEFVAVLVRL